MHRKISLSKRKICICWGFYLHMRKGGGGGLLLTTWFNKVILATSTIRLICDFHGVSSGRAKIMCFDYVGTDTISGAIIFWLVTGYYFSHIFFYGRQFVQDVTSNAFAFFNYTRWILFTRPFSQPRCICHHCPRLRPKEWAAVNWNRWELTMWIFPHLSLIGKMGSSGPGVVLQLGLDFWCYSTPYVFAMHCNIYNLLCIMKLLWRRMLMVLWTCGSSTHLSEAEDLWTWMTPTRQTENLQFLALSV